LPDGAFGGYQPNLDGACTEARAFPATLLLKAAIVRTGGLTVVTPAMAEWSRLGWFETAAFAVMRAQCCQDAPALTTPSKVEKCKMEEALAWMTNALDDDKAMDEAARAYADAARCVAKSGKSNLFQRFGPPVGGEERYFARIYDRIKKARGRK
jgi:hypothetical protein